eukprot:7433441-Prorocentrum_lima.AAC.1
MGCCGNCGRSLISSRIWSRVANACHSALYPPSSLSGKAKGSVMDANLEASHLNIQAPHPRTPQDL